MAGPSKAQRELGLAKITEIREMLRTVPKPPNPFRHDHTGPDPCLVCGQEPLPANVREIRRPA